LGVGCHRVSVADSLVRVEGLGATRARQLLSTLSPEFRFD
jgi:hypothetical protein